MIAPSVVQNIRRLLAEGKLSQRKIARMAGISRGTVGAIAAGRWPDYESVRCAADDEFPEPAGPPQRCPGCGGMVYLPCRLCHTRSLQAGASKPLLPAWWMQPEEPLGLELRDEDRARYEEVRSRRVDSFGSETSGGVAQPGEGPRSEPDDLCGVFEVEEDAWELDPADLWDAFEWDEEDPAIDGADVPDLSAFCLAADGERSPRDSM
jgi:transcriptional regulator with XRE-family HTH domain